MIECRTYRFHPGKLPQYLALFERDGVRERLLRYMRGYWLPESGTVNSAWHIWEYPDRAARAEARAGMAADPIVRGFMAEALPLLQEQQSVFMHGELSTPLRNGKAGVFDRINLSRSSGDPVEATASWDRLIERLLSHARIVASLRGSALEAGYSPTRALFVLRHDSFAARDQAASAIEEALDAAAREGWMSLGEPALLLPAPISPWQ